MSIHNLPASIAGSKFPFDDTLISRLRRGMSILMTYNDSVMRRGIVFLEPSSNPQFMWWQSRTRFVTGEVPVCQTLLHGIDEIRWPSLKLEPVPQFEIWFAKLPFAMKLLLGHPTRGQLRAPQPLKKTPPPQSSPKQAKWPREYEIHSPPCEVPSFVNTQGPLEGAIGQGSSKGKKDLFGYARRRFRATPQGAIGKEQQRFVVGHVRAFSVTPNSSTRPIFRRWGLLLGTIVCGASDRPHRAVHRHGLPCGPDVWGCRRPQGRGEVQSTRGAGRGVRPATQGLGPRRSFQTLGALG